MATPDEADGSQQLQNQRLGPADTEQVRATEQAGGQGLCDKGRVLPGTLVVEAEGDLVDTGWVVHHQAEARLGGEEEH